jgi:sugar phosphate isomerase/epimerase
MKLAFATLGCPAWGLEQIASNARDMGFDGVELRGMAGEHIGPEESAEARAGIRRLFEDAGIEIACIMGYSRFTGEEADQQAENIKIARQFVEVARDVGCPVLRVFGGQLPETGRDRIFGRVVEGLKAVTDQAEQAGVTVAIETHDDWCRGETLAAVLEAVNSPALGICWDVANSFTVEPPSTTYSAIAGQIAHVHFKDIAKTADGGHTSVLPGNGIVPLEEVLGILHNGGYTGTLSFEWEKKWQPDLAEPDVAFPHYITFTTGLMHKLGVPRG